MSFQKEPFPNLIKFHTVLQQMTRFVRVADYTGLNSLYDIDPFI